MGRYYYSDIKGPWLWLGTGGSATFIMRKYQEVPRATDGALPDLQVDRNFIYTFMIFL